MIYTSGGWNRCALYSVWPGPFMTVLVSSAKDHSSSGKSGAFLLIQNYSFFKRNLGRCFGSAEGIN